MSGCVTVASDLLAVGYYGRRVYVCVCTSTSMSEKTLISIKEERQIREEMTMMRVGERSPLAWAAELWE